MTSVWTPFKTFITNSCKDLWPEGGHCLSWRQPKNLVVDSSSAMLTKQTSRTRVGKSESRLSKEVMAGQNYTAVVLAEMKA